MRNDILERKKDILVWIEEHRSKAFICQQLHCKQDTLNRYLVKMNITYAGNQGSAGYKPHDSGYIPLERYLQSTSIRFPKVKEKLIREGYREDKCELCGISEWQGKKIVLEVHHKDGNHYNNTINNLQLLCPNCHSIQEVHKKSRAIYGGLAELEQAPD